MIQAIGVYLTFQVTFSIAEAQTHTTASQQSESEVEERLRVWVLNIQDELRNGTRHCRVLFLCEMTVRYYQNDTLEWMRMSFEERETQRNQNNSLKDQISNLRYRLVEPDLEFMQILEVIDRNDIPARKDYAHQQVQNEIWPELTAIEKIERWASDAHNALETRASQRTLFGLLDLNNVRLFYRPLIESNRQDLQEWIQKETEEREALRRMAQNTGRPLSRSIS